MIKEFTQLFHYLLGERPGMNAARWDEGKLSTFIAPKTSLMIENTVRLVDVSFWQGVIDFDKMREANIAGAIIRAGQRTWPDTRFKENWVKAKAARLPRGSYWFYDSREDPVKQAQLWWSLVKDDIGELPHVADLEENYGGLYGKPEHFRLFVKTFMTFSGLPANKIVIYTGYYWWQSRVGPDSYFKQFKVWIAWYADMQYVRVPAPWLEADLIYWQYTSSGDGLYYGVSSKEIDLNYYCCSPAKFQLFAGTLPEVPVPLPPDPPQGDNNNMSYYELQSTSSTSSRSIRQGPSVKYAKVAVAPDLFAGKTAKAGATNADVHVYTEDVPDPSFIDGVLARAGDTWRKVYENNGVTTSGWIAEIHKGEVLLNKKLISDGPVQYADVPLTIEVGDDVTYEKQTISILLKVKR